MSVLSTNTRKNQTQHNKDQGVNETESGPINYIKRIWEYRYFWMSLVRADLKRRYRRSILGMGWSLISPVAMTAVLCVVYRKILNVDLVTFAPYLLAGLATWGFLNSVVVAATTCFRFAEAYIRQEPAPMMIYPLRAVLGAAFHAGISLGLAVVVAFIASFFAEPEQLRGPLSLAFLPSFIAGLLILVFFCLAVGSLIAVAASYFPDLTHLSEIGMQMLFFLTPVIWPKRLLLQGPEGEARGYSVYLLNNPLAAIVDVVREPILTGDFAEGRAYAIAVGTTLFMWVLVAFVYRRCEHKIIYTL
jgi:lipopolysaccharide transport system permease protein